MRLFAGKFCLMVALAFFWILPINAQDQSAQTAAISSDQKGPDTKETPEERYITWGDRKIFFGVDFAVVSYEDQSMAGSMGRERQMVPAYVVLSLYGDYNDHVSYRLEINPVDRSMTPRPYVPEAEPRRVYFFPNQPDSLGARGVSSVPEGLYNVDDYKTLGVDPIQQLSGLRVGYFEFHSASKRYGVQVGRFYVPQGLGLENVEWLSAKDLVHMQIIDAAADNGALAYFDSKKLRVEVAGITGNSSVHDYGYYDFTSGEDKNSAIGGVFRVTYRPLESLMLSFSGKQNYSNSRIEDATSLQLSKRYDNAFLLSGRWRQSQYLTVFGEGGVYKWGQRDTSAELMPGLRPHTPIFKKGYYAGVDVYSPKLKFGRLAATFVRSELDRDDSLVAWASANNLYGAVLGKKERSNVLKLQAHIGGNLTLFWFTHHLSNPFPELSAIKPISGPGSDKDADNNKSGMGLRFRF